MYSVRLGGLRGCELAVATFDLKLEVGLVGESRIAGWLRRKGYSVLPAYEKVIDDQKGPRFYAPDESLVAPDMLTFHKPKPPVWVEAKTKKRFTWYGIGHYWTTGINYRHYRDYLRVSETSGYSVWLLFLHTDSDTWENDIKRWGAPPVCPVGLFACDITTAKSHDAKDWSGVHLIYWPFSRLVKLAELGDL